MAGLLDGTAGVILYFVFKHLRIFQVLQYMASGIFGSAAFTKGVLIVIIGLILHFIIVLAFSIVIFWIYPKINSFEQIFGSRVWYTF